MPLVKMPDGAEVDMPENPTPEQKERLQKVIAKMHQLPGQGVAPPLPDQEEEVRNLHLSTAPPKDAPRTNKEKMGFVTGNINKGIAQLLGGPVDLLATVTPGTSIEGSIGGSHWWEDLMKQHHMLTGSAAPRGKGEKLAADMLQAGTQLLTLGSGTKIAQKGIGLVKDLAERRPPTGVVSGPDPRRELAKDLRKDGFVFSPSDLKPTTTNKTITKVAGNRELNQELSVVNDEVAKNLIRKDLGVSVNTPLTQNTVDMIREDVGKTYSKVRALPDMFKLDTAYLKGIDEINSEFASLEAKFPGLTKTPEVEEFKKLLVNDKAVKEGLTPGEAIDLSRILRQKTTAAFKKAYGQSGTPSDLALAQAQRDAAKTVEDLISRNVKSSKFPKLYDEWADARKKYAISHDVEASVNLDAGTVNMPQVAGLARKGRPLSGGMESIARFSRSFPHSSQPIEKMGSGSPDKLDLILTGVGSVIGHSKGGYVGGIAGGAAGAMTRPAIRKGLTSDKYQDLLVGKKKFDKKKLLEEEEE